MGLLPLRPAATLRLWLQQQRRSSSSTRHVVRKQLSDITELAARVSAVNSSNEKQKIVAEYPQLREVLELVYGDKTRFGITSSTVKSLLQRQERDSAEESNGQLPLEDLLRRLMRNGGNADRKDKDLVRDFVASHIGLDMLTEEEQALLDSFLRIIDRDLGVGIGRNTLRKVSWPDAFGGQEQIDNRQEGNQESSSNGEDDARLRRDPNPSLESFSCALGKSISPPFTELAKRQGKWYASRKLDGVRVLSLIDFVVPVDPTRPISLAEIQCVSRYGNEFQSLDRLKDQLRYLERYPGLRELLTRDPVIVDETDDGEVVKRLVLDGEICVMVPTQHATRGQSRVSDDGTGALAIWQDDGLVEDFPQAVSLIKRSGQMDNPVYFVFDMISGAEAGTAGAVNAPGLGRTFGERIPETQALVGWLREEIKRETSTEPKIRTLVQWPMEAGDAEAMVERAVREGWEGLIFRADAPYKGKRSPDIRKFKKFQDAEYTVVGMDVSQQRLPVNGVYGVYEACSNVWIEHKGHRVSVGSGFTPAERIAYAKDRSLIVGKQITVEYFSESELASREGIKSLRFPRIKKVWEGERDV